ncbi:MAG: hypothetical protein JWN72_1441 [Thermoleophilia bacterium]|nr:hypothetical protein [Thermoleophilia bacterium]
MRLPHLSAARATPVALLAALLVAAALLAAGCGGDARASYQRDLAEAGATVSRALDKLPRDETTTVTPTQVHDLADELRDASGDIDGLDAPDEATQKAQDQMTSGLTGVADAFDGLADELDGAGDDDAKAELFVAFASDTKIDAAFADISEAQAKYAAAGFHVFGKGPAPAGVATTK